MRAARLPLALAVLAAAALLHASPVQAAPKSTTLLLYTADEPTISWDKRVNRYVAFTYGGAQRDIVLVKRAQPWGSTGTPWTVGDYVLVSQGIGGASNGDSFSPALGGDESHAPKCLVFASAASNLVSGDTNGKADVFVKPLPSGALRRISAPASVSEVTVDGACREVVYIAGGRAYAQRIAGGNRVAHGAANGGLVLSPDASTLAYVRGGAVYAGRLSGRLRRVGGGNAPTLDAQGRYVAYESGGQIRRGSVRGHGRGSVVGEGTSPSLTAGGTFLYYAQGNEVRSSVKASNIGTCQVGEVASVKASTRGNYVVYSCTDPGLVYLSYIGGK